MSDAAHDACEAAERLRRRDSTLECIILDENKPTNAELSELADCLLEHPDVATDVCLIRDLLPDEICNKLSRYVATSTKIRGLYLSCDQLDESTYMAFSKALRFNSSLWGLVLLSNQTVDQIRIDAAFVVALRLNSDRPAKSEWHFYSRSNEFARLTNVAFALGPPSMCAQLDFAQDYIEK